MGCFLGKQDINDIHPDIFSVHNVDNAGRLTTTGKIKVTDNSLELIRLGLPDMVWSLRSLRQYGHDADIFTFESGRRGPQGPGVYSFRCNRSKQLFELVQKNVHRNQEEQTSRRISLGTIIDPPTEPQTLLTPPPNPGVTTPFENPMSPTLVAPNGLPSTEFTNAQYMNVALPPNPTTPTTSGPTLTQPYERLVPMGGEQYENVTLGVVPSTPKSPMDPLPLPPISPRGYLTLKNPEDDPKVSYATLELNPVDNVLNETNSETNNNINEVSNHENEENEGSYATINLDMTHALSNLNAGQSNPDEGIRRTRHNSTLDGISGFNAKIPG